MNKFPKSNRDLLGVNFPWCIAVFAGTKTSFRLFDTKTIKRTLKCSKCSFQCYELVKYVAVNDNRRQQIHEFNFRRQYNRHTYLLSTSFPLQTNSAPWNLSSPRHSSIYTNSYKQHNSSFFLVHSTFFHERGWPYSLFHLDANPVHPGSL